MTSFSHESEPIAFSQYAQDPQLDYDEFEEMIRRKAECSKSAESDAANVKKSRQRRREKPATSNKKTLKSKSFVMSRLQRRGIKLIKISVTDLINNVQTSDSESDNENIILNAQYIVKDNIDSILDDTESLVKKISKSLIDSDFSF